MAGLGKICPQLEEVWGGEDCWGEAASKDDRWRKVLSSGCREGRELRRIWLKIMTEAEQCAAYLGEEVPEALRQRLLGLGDGSVSGATRGVVVQAAEDQRAKVLTKALEEVRPKSTRAAWGWRQRDKVQGSYRRHYTLFYINVFRITLFRHYSEN